MSGVDWSDPKARMAHARAQRGLGGRAKVLPIMGKQIELEAAKSNPPPVTRNPILEASEPFAFPTPTKPEPQIGPHEPRMVVEAEIDELMEWGLPLYQEIYPRCTEESVRPMLILATRGGRMRFLRTKEACSLFVVERTAWEPLLFAYQVFVVARFTTGASDRGAYRLVRASKQWAEEIGAVGFEFGKARCSVNLQNSNEFLRHLSVIVPEQKNESWVKLLNQPVAEDVGAGARMRAMEMAANAPEPVG